MLAALSPDTTLVAIASPSSHLEVRRWSDDTLVAGITNGIYGVAALAFSGDGTLLAGAAADGVKLWKVADGSLVRTIPGLAGATMLAVSFAGDVVGAGFSVNPGVVKVWNQVDPTNLATLSGGGGPPAGLAVTPDGAHVAVTYAKQQGLSMHGHITFWPSAGGTPVWDHDDALMSMLGRIVVSPDGTMLAASGQSPGSGNLYSTADGSLIRQVSGLADPWAFSSDGAALVGTSRTSPGGPSIFHVSDGTLAHSYAAPSGKPLVLGVGPSYAVRTFDLVSGTGFNFVENGVALASQSGTLIDSAQYLAISPSGHLVATAPEAETGAHVTMWDADTLQATGVVYAGDGPMVLTSGGTLLHASGTTLYFEGVRPAITTTPTIWALALSPSEQALALGNSDNTATLRDATTGAVLQTLWTFNDGHTGAVRAVAFSHDGATVATGSDDLTIKLWAAASGTFIRTLTGAQKSIRSIAFTSDDARLLTGDWNGDLRLWQVSDGTPISMVHLTWPSPSAVLSPNDTIVYVAGQTLQRFHLPDWAPLPDIPGHVAGIDAVALSADGTRLVSGSGGFNGTFIGGARLDCLP